MVGETVWLMDSDFCENCGCELDSISESGYCFDCAQDQLYAEEEALYGDNDFDCDFDEQGNYIGG